MQPSIMGKKNKRSVPFFFGSGTLNQETKMGAALYLSGCDVKPIKTDGSCNKNIVSLLSSFRDVLKFGADKPRVVMCAE